MKNQKLKYLLFFLLVFPTLLFSQQEKPKVALILSGGGAKGLAHIPVIQTLDSLGIVPDLIIGTSMGSIVGGLYAMGYSGDEIEKIANSADWDELLGGDIELNKVSVEEKSEFKKYLIEMDVIDWKPKLQSSLLKDQNLREFLAEATFPVYEISNFDSLSIPFRAIATDIVNGKEVVMKEGSLALAMRASMSIPSIFQPVEYNDVLLIDGGVLNNFPVDVALDMGANFIIGSNVGSGMLPKEELEESIGNLLFQTSMMSSNLKNDVNVKLCDILIDHVPNLEFSAGDFNKGKEIYEEGKIATKLNEEAFVKLANRLKPYKQLTHKVPFRKDVIVLDTIIYKGVSIENLELVKSRTNIKADHTYTSQDIIDGINRALGTRIFKKITFKPVNIDDLVGLELTAFEHSKNQIKGSIHYDTNRGVGLILNYTGRNIFGENSRILLNVDVAEQPKARVQYQKNFGNNKEWWVRNEMLGVYLDQKIYYGGTAIDDVKYYYFQSNNEINRNLNSLDSYVGAGINYEYTKLKPEVNPDIIDNVFGLDTYKFKTVDINIHYYYNSLNDVFFATQGSHFFARLSRSIYTDAYLKTTDLNEAPVKGKTNKFMKLNLLYEKRFPINKKISGIINASSNFSFMDNLSSDELPFEDFGYAATYFLGGNMQNERNNSFVFPGLKEDEFNVSQVMNLNLGVQFSPFSKVYMVPHVNIASVGFNDFNDYMKDAFSPSGDWTKQFDTSAIFSSGITVSYHSILGPVNFDISYVNRIDKFRLFFSVGLLFHETK